MYEPYVLERPVSQWNYTDRVFYGVFAFLLPLSIARPTTFCFSMKLILGLCVKMFSHACMIFGECFRVMFLVVWNGDLESVIR